MKSVAGAGLAILLALAPVAGQAPGQEEVALIREATLHEAAGDLTSAEGALSRVLESRPASAPALLALERVLRHQGRRDALIPRVRAGLEAEPESAILNQIHLRTLSALDQVEALEGAVRAWIAASPDMEVPYREAARTWEIRGDYTRAREVLEQGRGRLTAHDALALELGSLYAALDQPALAAREWDRAIGEDGSGVAQVRRQLRALPDGGARLLADLVGRLAADPVTQGRLRAGLELALAAGLEEPGIELARRVVAAQAEGDREAMLLDVARKADGARMSRLAHYAYGALVEGGGHRGLPALHARFAELALVVGDTAGAARSFRTLEQEEGLGQSQRRAAAALRIELLASQDPDAAAAALLESRDNGWPGAETDRVAALVAAAYVEVGRADDALSTIAGVRGPRTALLRGRLALLAGDREGARSAFMAAAPGLRGAEATRALALVTLLGRLTDRGARAVGEAVAAAADGEPGLGLDRLAEALGGVDPVERAALLAFAANLADDHSLRADAVRLRERLVVEHPTAPETPAALLALARDREGIEAVELLERIIVEYPRSTLVPQARSELERVRRNGIDNHNHSGM
jgi:hypothetical protein